MSNSMPLLHAECEMTLTQEQFNQFAALSGDLNPIHLDAHFASQTSFGTTVAHGMFLFGVIRNLIGRIAPASQIISQQIKFPAPAHCGDVIAFNVSAVPRQPQFSILAQRLSDKQSVCEGICVIAIMSEAKNAPA